MDKLTKVRGFGDSGMCKTKEGGVAYKNTLKEDLEELFTLGLLNGTFYTNQEDIIVNSAEIFKRALHECPEYATKCAIYGSQVANLKTIPTLWAVYVSTLKDKTLFKKSFPKIIRNFNMLHDFMEFCRKGGIREGLGRSLKETINKRYIEMINEYHATRSKGMLSEIAKTTRPCNNDEGFQKLMKYVSKNELTFPRAVALKAVIEGINDGMYTLEMDKLVREHKLQLEELKHSTKNIGVNEKRALYSSIYENISYSSLILNLVALERVFDNEIPKEVADIVYNRIVDEKAFYKSRMLPFALINAERMIKTPRFRYALNELINTVSGRVFDIDKEADILVGVDTSGSMSNTILGSLTLKEVASLFGAMIKNSHSKSNICAVASECKKVNIDERCEDNVFEISKSIAETGVGHGTCFESLLQDYNGEKFVILITDDEPSDSLEYMWIRTAKKKGAKLIIWKVASSGHQISKDKSVTYVNGYSDRVLGLIKNIIESNGSLAKEIEAINI